MKLPILILPLPVKPLRRIAQVDTQDPIHRLQSFRLGLPHPRNARFLREQIADVARPLPHLIIQTGVHPRRIARTFRFRHRRLGNNAVFPHQADEHIPLPAVPQRLPQQPSHHPVIHRPVRGLNHRFQNVVGPLQLVPEHHIVLAELKILDLQQIPGFRPKQVQPGEHPAPPGTRLIGDFPIVQQRGKAVVGFGNDAAVQRHLINIPLRNHILHQPIARLRLKIRLKIGHRRQVQGAGVSLRRHNRSLSI